MFENIRKCLDEFENIAQELKDTGTLSEEKLAILEYSDLHLAEALLKDWRFTHILANIILATDKR